MGNIKIGSKVKLIANSAQSMHKIGTIGRVVTMADKNAGNLVLLLISANDLCHDGGTWSYLKDVILLPGELNKSIKVI